MRPKMDQFVADTWLAGIPACELEALLRNDGHSAELVEAALDVYEGLDQWAARSLQKLAASCNDWREF